MLENNHQTSKKKSVSLFTQGIEYLLLKGIPSCRMRKDKIKITPEGFEYCKRITWEEYINRGIVSPTRALVILTRNIGEGLYELSKDNNYNPDSEEMLSLRSEPVVQELEQLINAYTYELGENATILLVINQVEFHAAHGMLFESLSNSMRGRGKLRRHAKALR